MKRESKIRLALFAGSAGILCIVAVFLWLINMGQSDAMRRTFFLYMGILGSLALGALGFFFAFAEVFDADGQVYTSRIITMLVTILMLVQLALAFSSYTNQSMEFSFRTFEKAYKTVTEIDAGSEADRQELLELAATEEFAYMAIADGDGIVRNSSDSALIASPAPEDGALSFRLYSGDRLIAKPSSEYRDAVTGEMIVSQLTLLIISLLFSVEFVMFIVGRVSRIGQGREKAGEAPAILTNVRQVAFLFYFASRLSASFIPIMAKALPVGSLPLSPNMIAALPQTVETFLTCFAILFTNTFLAKKGWKPPFLFGLVLVALGTFGSALAPTLALFTAARALIGLGYGFCWMTMRSVALFGKSPESRLQGFSMLNAGLYAGMFCGSTVGSIIAVTYGYKTVLVVSAILTGVCGLSIFTMSNQRLAQAPRSAASANGFRQRLTFRDLAGFALFLLLMIAPSCVVVAYSGYFLPVYYEDIGRGALEVGRAQLLYGMLIVYLGPALSRFLVKRKVRPLLANIVYNLLLSAGLIVLGLYGGFAASLVAISLIAVGDGFGFGVQNNYFLAMPVNRLMGDSRALMFMSLSKKLMEMLGPTVFALSISVSMTGGVLTMGVCVAAAAVAYGLVSVFLRDRKKPANAELEG